MIYKFKSQDILNTNNINDFFKTNKTLKLDGNKRRFYYGSLCVIILFLSYLFSLSIDNDAWKTMIPCAIVCISLTIFLPYLPRTLMKIAYHKIGEHYVEVTEEGIFYDNDITSNTYSKINLIKNKMKLLEMDSNSEYTSLIYEVQPYKKIFKRYYILLIPNSIFKNEIEYNNFLTPLDNHFTVTTNKI